jgi:hypothetical protein
MRRNAVVQAPIARASDRIAAAEVTFLFLICRQPKTASERRESSQGTIRISLLASRCRSGEPNAFLASLGSRPRSIASSICACSSSSISRFRRSPRKTFVIRDHNDISVHPQDLDWIDSRGVDYCWQRGQ